MRILNGRETFVAEMKEIFRQLKELYVQLRQCNERYKGKPAIILVAILGLLRRLQAVFFYHIIPPRRIFIEHTEYVGKPYWILLVQTKTINSCPLLPKT